MSEYQRVIFRAIDAPVSEKNLEYMERQSTRAEVTKWSFDNEYHYGDFRGDVFEMLRRGYDIHLHYANFGYRKLLLRLPDGLPDRRAAKPYFSDGFEFVADKRGPGGILCVNPSLEPGEFEPVYNLDELIDRLIPLRSEILDGDLRPFYLSSLAAACDDYQDPEEAIEGPVPAGLTDLSDAQRGLAEYFEIGDSFLAAAAECAPKLAEKADARSEHALWLNSLDESLKDRWLVRLISEQPATVRSEILSQFRKHQKRPAWPVIHRGRTIAELEAAAATIQNAVDRKKAQAVERARAKRLAMVAANPSEVLSKTEALAKDRKASSYEEIARLLTDLRDALVGTEQSLLAEQQAIKLKDENPYCLRMIEILRSADLLPKRWQRKSRE